MKRLTDRRTVLLAAGTAAALAVAEAVAAQPTDIRGTVMFDEGAVIPKGNIEIYLEDSAVQDNARLRTTTTRIKSDGGSTVMDFSLSLPASAIVSPTLQVVARLERADDGWLLARGSAQISTDMPTEIMLSTVMY